MKRLYFQFFLFINNQERKLLETQQEYKNIQNINLILTIKNSRVWLLKKIIWIKVSTLTLVNLY